MASKSENRRINLYINGKEVQNNIRSIRQEYIKATSQLNHMTRGSKEYHNQVKKVKSLKKLMDDHNKTLGKTSRAWANFKRNIGGWIAAGFGLAAAGRIFNSFTNNIKNFEKEADNLSSLTGLMGDELEYLKNKALDMNKELKDSGVRIKQTGIDILEAYKIVGSAKPELLQNKEALAEVTKQAIILSNAAEMDLASAVKALTGDLNQFGESADQSNRFINVLAAGAQAGAGNIEYITQATEKAGTTMDLMGISYEKGVALIETAAPRFAQAAMAGNSLDKVLLKMKEKGIGYTNGVFDMNDALLELKTRFNNGETSAKIFGVEHSKMAEVLVQGIDDFNRYTEAVTGTNIAIEQAETNTDNLSSRISNLSSTWSNFMLSLEDGEGFLAKFVKGMIDVADTAVEEWRRWTKSDDQEAYEAKLKYQQEFIQKFKSNNKLFQKDVEIEWGKKLDTQLKAFELFGEHYNSEQVEQMNQELENIYEHLNLIKQAKAEIAFASMDGGTDGEDGEGEDGLEFTQMDEDSLEKMELLSLAEIEIQNTKLQVMEQRHSEYVSAIAAKEKWLTNEKANLIKDSAGAAMKLGDALVNFNIASMNKELAAAGDNEAERDRIRKEYAKKNQQISIMQARIAGAMAIMNIWSGQISGNPLADTIIKAILTGAQILQTESQVAVIKSQTFAQGGYTDGATHYIAGEAGREYVAPNWQLEHPVYGPIIDDLNQARLGAAPTSSSVSNITNNYGGDNSAFNEKMDVLIELLSDPENRRATFQYDDLTRYEDELDELKGLANVA